MKKLITTLLATLSLLAIAFTLASCGEDNPPPPEPTPCEHEFEDEWTVTKEPTKKKNGSEYNDCSLCGERVTRAIPKIVIDKIVMASAPKTTAYFKNEKFNSLGLIVEAVYTDGSKVIVKDFTIDKTEQLSPEDTEIKVTYEGYELIIPITVSSAIRTSVSDVKTYEADTLLYVEGIYAGYYVDNVGNKRLLIKDKNTESIIALDGVTYNENYADGDELAFYANSVINGSTYSLAFSSANGDKASTVVKEGNYFTYYFKTAVDVTTANDLAALFADGGISENTFVKINGNFFIQRVGGDYRIHMNPAATSESGILVGGKVIKLHDENLDGTWLENKITMTGSEEIPGLWVSGELNVLYTGSDANEIRFSVLRDNWVSVSKYDPNHDYIVEMAYAYRNQGYQVDYDQYNTRRNVNISPEQATEYQRIFLDCSSYVNAVYYNAFGVNVLPYPTTEKGPTTANFATYAKENQANDDVVAFYENTGFTAEEKQEILDALKKELQIGDVIVYRKTNNAGHALIYVGEGVILHCANSGSYEENTKNPLESYDQLGKGDILTESVENLFERPTATRYLLSDAYTNFSIIRPLARGLTPTEQMTSRMTLPGLCIEKSSTAPMYTAVYTGDKITYTITLDNTKTDLNPKKGIRKITGITVNELVPAGTVFTSGSEGVSANGDIITWTGDVDKDSIVKITYTVTVVSTEKGLIINSNQGTVNGLMLNSITNTLSGISAAKMAELKAKAEEYITSSKKFSDPILMAKTLYMDVFGIDLFSYTSVASALEDIIDIENKNCNPEAEVSDMVIENLSGGYLVRGSNSRNNERIRAIRKEYLSCGDIIMAKYVNSSDVVCTVLYVYLGDGSFIQVDSASGECKAAVVDLNQTKNILVALYSYDTYAILRPSMTVEAN